MTPKQLAMLEAIREHLKQWRIPPSRSDLARALGLKNQSAVDARLNGLAKKGWIELFPGIERGIRLLREGAPILDADELLAVTARTPILAEEPYVPTRLDDFESLSWQFEARPDWFVRVRGDSLDKIGFRTGDIVAVRRVSEARDGDIVVARIGRVITMKRYRPTHEHWIELQPESTNSTHRSIRVDLMVDDFEILGTVVGAIIGTRYDPDDGSDRSRSRGDTGKATAGGETDEEDSDAELPAFLLASACQKIYIYLNPKNKWQFKIAKNFHVR